MKWKFSQCNGNNIFVERFKLYCKVQGSFETKQNCSLHRTQTHVWEKLAQHLLLSVFSGLFECFTVVKMKEIFFFSKMCYFKVNEKVLFQLFQLHKTIYRW